MNARKARELRKSLLMTKENLRQKEYSRINPVRKIVYFTNSRGVLIPQESVRSQIVNKNLHYYRMQKKIISRGFYNGWK